MTLFLVVKEYLEYSGKTVPQIITFTYVWLSAYEDKVLGGQVFTENILIKIRSVIGLTGYF